MKLIIYLRNIKYSCSVLFAFFICTLMSGCSPTPQSEVDINQTKFPKQYETWLQTSEQTENVDMLENYPASIILWAGSAYAKEYRSPRGHHFAVTDVAQVLRTGTQDNDLSASCWSCKTPVATQLMKEHGVEGFAAKTFMEVGPEVDSVVYCSDCHEENSAKLALPRPHAQDAMGKIKTPFDKQSKSMQGAQTCGQCHVTYYFQPELSNKVNIPWIFGSTADEIEKYYDTRRFYEWIHPISKTPILKARHPEYEHWSRSQHAANGVTCITCHMPPAEDESGTAFTSHKIGKALDNFDQACRDCHQSQSDIEASLQASKAELDAQARQVESLLVKAHYEAKAAWDGGANWNQMNDVLMGIRHAQWRWDFAMSSHGLYAHNPQEGRDLLTKATAQIEMARMLLAMVLKQNGVVTVNYPDISSKAAAHQAIGFIESEAVQAKQAFIEQEVKQHWQPVANR